MAFAQNIRHLARKAAAATAITATASCEKEDAPTLREWLEKDAFSAAFSQGFGCEAASIGVALGLADGVGGPRELRRRLDGVAGASSGAKVAAVLAAPNCPLEAFETLVKRMRFRDALLDFDDLAIYEGGWARLSTFRKHFAALVGGRNIESLDMLPFATTAFDLKRLRSDILSEGPLELVCFASGAFPPLFPPVHIGSSLYTDVAFFTDASGCRGLQTSPASRVLQVCHADVPFNGPWVVESPASLGVREVCSVVLTGNTRVVPLPPGARVRVAAALDGAREAVVAALDRPLERVAPGHYVCRVSPQKRVAGVVDALALSALVAGAAGVVVGVLRRR